MSIHSYSRCWIHFTWATLNRQRLLQKPAALKLSSFLYEYAQSKDLYMKINYVNSEHVHALIDLPTKYSIEEVIKLLKGASAHWINQERIITAKFSWGAWIWSVFCISVERRCRRKIHCESGGASSKEKFRRRIRKVCARVWAAMAR